MIITTLLAAALSAGAPAIDNAAAMKCNPEPSKARGCIAGKASAKPGLRTAAVRPCNPEPSKARGCLRHDTSKQQDAEALATRETGQTYD